MTAPSATFQTKLAADQIARVWLVSFSTFNYTLYDTDVVFSATTYTGTSGKLSAIEETAQGTVPTVSLTLQNVDRVIRDWLRGDDRRGTEVTIRVVMSDNLADSDGYLQRLFDIDSYTWEDRDAILSLTESPLLQGMRCPSRTTNPHFCPWVFKGDECGYNGPITECDFTYQDCKERHGTDPKRYGGFLGKPKQSLGWF